MKSFKIYIISALLLSGTLQSQTALHVGTRPQGMGGAFVALANDVNAVYWNPAGLCQLSRGETTFMYWGFQDVSQIQVNHLSFAYPVGRGTGGFAWTRLGADLEEGPDARMSIMSENQFVLSYGMALSSRFALGVSVNRMRLDSKAGNGTGLGYQLGGLINLMGDQTWTLGFIGKNLLANVQNDAVPASYTLGTAFQFRSPDDVHLFSLAADIQSLEGVNGRDGLSVQFATGAEYRLKLNGYSISLRGGIGTNMFSYGFGFGFGGILIDYAYVQMREKTIGDAFKMGASFSFGRPSVENRWAPPPPQFEEKSREKELFLSISIRNNRIHLAWNDIKDATGYRVIARLAGEEWAVLNKDILTRTTLSVPIKRHGIKLEFMIAAVKGSQVLKRSNRVEVSL